MKLASVEARALAREHVLYPRACRPGARRGGWRTGSTRHDSDKDLERILSTTRVDIATPSILRNPYRRKAILAELKEFHAAL